MKILITGGDGCVGTALKMLCLNDDKWIFVNRKDCDLENREGTIELFKQIKPTHIIHLASYVPGFYNINKVASFSSNIRINENVLEAANLASVQKGLFCFSVNMFSEELSKFPLVETMIFDGHITGNFSGYAYSKRMLALQCQNYNEQYGRQYFGIIPSNIYGPNDNMESGRLIPNLISKFIYALKNKTDISLNGSGSPLRQFIYSYDLAEIIKYLIIQYSDTKPINCCNDEEYTIAKLAIILSEILNFKGQIKFDPSKGDGALRKTMNNQYLKKLMPNISFISLDTGLRKTTICLGLL